MSFSSVSPLRVAPRVSVVVPVYNPGPYFERCLSSILSQTMPRDAFEAIFVDDGSTDETPARLDALAAAHPHIRVIHQPNSGWPGKPRNVGMDAARGEYVFFADHDDVLGDEALERMWAMADRLGSDVVIGRTASAYGAISRRLFAPDREQARLIDTPLLESPTPHKLVRRAFVEQHGIRFPEGRRPLEDLIFVIHTYLHADVISVLADYVCYYHIRRDDGGNAWLSGFDPELYADAVRQVIGIIEGHTQPGSLRDTLLERIARMELLGRLRGGRLLDSSEDDRRALFRELGAIIEEHIPMSVDALLVPSERVRIAIVRSGRLDLLVMQAQSDVEVKVGARIASGPATSDGTLVLGVDAWLEARGLPLALERGLEGRLLTVPPDVAAAVPVAARRVGPAFGSATMMVRHHDTAEELPLSVEVVGRVVEPPDGFEYVTYRIDAILDPEALASGGRSMRPGRWDVIVRIEQAGHEREGRIHRPARALDDRMDVARGRHLVTTASWTKRGRLVIKVRPASQADGGRTRLTRSVRRVGRAAVRLYPPEPRP